MYVGLAIKSEPMIREGGEYDRWEHAGGWIWIEEAKGCACICVFDRVR